MAQSTRKPPSGERWVHELKFDGYRMVALVVDAKATLWSRNGQPWTAKVPRIARALEKVGVTHAALDGELIAGGGRREDFGLLQAVLSGKAREPLSLVLFDLLHLDGVSVEACPLIDRKNLLARVLAHRAPPLELSTHGDAETAGVVVELARRGGYEGIVSKRTDRPYVHDRSDDWLKTKDQSTEEYAVVGFTREPGAKTGFSSLLRARPGADGWVYAGRVSTGFSNEQIRVLSAQMQGGRDSPTVGGDTSRPSLRNATWITPSLVAEINYRGTGRSGVLRQASFHRIRHDKRAEDL